MRIDSIKKWVTCDVVRLQSVVSWLSVGYQLVVSRLLGRLGYQSVNCQLSGSCQAVVRQLLGSSQYDKADLNKSQKSRPKKPTASKAIS